MHTLVPVHLNLVDLECLWLSSILASSLEDVADRTASKETGSIELCDGPDGTACPARITTVGNDDACAQLFICMQWGLRWWHATSENLIALLV